MLLSAASVVLVPVVVVQAAGGSESYLLWMAFVGLVIGGAATVLQAIRIGRVGAGYVLPTGTAFVAVPACILAIETGGPAALGTLVVICAVFEVAVSTRLSALRRIITPTVSGTVIMLIPVTVMPIAFDLLSSAPEGSSAMAAPASALATFAVIVAITLRASGVWRSWAPIAGVAAGCAVALGFGIYDIEPAIEAPWIGIPVDGWPGFRFELGSSVWTLLPLFLLLTVVIVVQNNGNTIAIQRLSWRRPRVVDFRAVQRAVAANGVSNLLSGLACAVPNVTSPAGVSFVQLTGVAARDVGVCVGVVFIAIAFLPKVLALLIAIPGPVIGAFLLVVLAILFVEGMKTVVQDGLDREKVLVVGIAFWIGVGFESKAIFTTQIGGPWESLLGNGITAGGLTAIFMTILSELAEPRRMRLRVSLDSASVRDIDAFLQNFASRRGLSDEMTRRLRAAGEEALLALAGRGEEKGPSKGRRLILVAGGGAQRVELEFIAIAGEGNIEDRIGLIREQAAGMLVEDGISLRLLRHYASSVRHQQYHDTNIVTLTLRIEPSGPRASTE